MTPSRHVSSPSEPGVAQAAAGNARAFCKDTRGAVYVEFLIAFMPVFVFFLCLLQLALLFSAKLLVEHAAVSGSRAAAVVFGDEPGAYGTQGEHNDEVNTLTSARRQAVRDAVLVSLAPLILDGSIARVNVVYPEAQVPGGVDQPENTKLVPMTGASTSMMRVRVEADVVCKIAMANVIACGGDVGRTRVKTAVAESVFPYQGASYVYE